MVSPISGTFRRALALGIDREQIQRGLFPRARRNGDADHRPISFRKARARTYRSALGHAWDVAKANAMLDRDRPEEEGRRGGFRMRTDKDERLRLQDQNVAAKRWSPGPGAARAGRK